DPGRTLYKEIGVTERLTGARVKREGGWDGVTVTGALDEVAAKLRAAGPEAAFVATPQATNEDLFAFKALADTAGGLLDFRVGDPQHTLRERLDHVLQRKDRNPNTQGALDLGLARDGVAAILKRCASGEIKALVLQGPELLRDPDHVDAIAGVPFVAVMATHEGPELGRPDVVLPAAMWAEVDGTFTNFQRRVQRIRAAFAAPGDARPRWELSAELLRRCGGTLAATSARDVFARLSASVPDYAGLDYRALGSTGRALPLKGLAAAEARA
ncbi:MAG TPA: molybdopterin-dependent oxidoreductase, partial [Solirubrobacterales bacterium]|nr:molybdopterin-dependent oxidoreductase [Solirubrobacterales bacterium]